jgi:hypothetical protein
LKGRILRKLAALSPDRLVQNQPAAFDRLQY